MNHLTDAERLALAERALLDPVWALQEFFPHWFPKPIPWVHRGIIAIVLRQTGFLVKYGQINKIVSNFTYKIDPTDPQSAEESIFVPRADGTILLRIGRYTLIKLPRGYSKTTLTNALVILMTCFHIHKFPLYLSESGPHACKQLGAVKRELEANEKLRAVFGDLVPGRQDSAKWAEDQIETTTGVYAMARGRGGQVRGSNINGQRPDFVIFDDVEDKESVSTAEQRAKVKDWFVEDVMPVLPEMDPHASMLGLGTLLHRDALLQILEQMSEFTTISFGAYDKQGDLLWPDMMDETKLQSKKAIFTKAGNLAGYYREYHNTLRDEETQKFRQDMIRYATVPAEEVVAIAVACDPAIAKLKLKKSDYFFLAGVGMTDKGLIDVFRADGTKGLTPRAQVDAIFDYVRWAKTTFPSSRLHVGIEANAYQAALVHLVREEMFRKKLYFEVVPITHNTDKILRVEGVLQPRYASGYVVHAKKHVLLEEQLLDWPNGKLDGPDCVAMAVTLLDPHAAHASPENEDLAADQYESQERMIGGDWRHAP